MDGQGAFTPRAVYRTVTAMDARGNVTEDVLGNGIERSHGFDGQTGRVQSIEAGLATATDRQDLAYAWDALGNLKQRSRNGTARIEDFCYDDLNRLTRSRLTAGPGPQPDLCRSTPGEPGAIETVTYDGYGNIRTRSGVAYSYGSDTGVSPLSTAGPHAVASVTKADGARVDYVYDANGNNTSSSDGRTIAYTAFDKPASIAKGNHTTAFAYGPDRSRFLRRDSEDGTLRTTTLYLGNVEKITDANGRTRIRRHIAGVAIETTGPAPGRCSADGATVTRYVLRDHLGSVDVLTDSDGDVFEEARFGPWGTRRDATTGGDLTEAAAMAFDHCATTRGFTDHEMLDEVGLVHMNGRIYDPRLGRFLQADPYVQFPGNLQNHNRYSYVMNNPLSYTDPTGYFLGKLLRPLAGIAITIWMPGAGFWAGSTLFAANGIGAVAVSGFVAGAVTSGNLKGAVMGAFSAAAFHGIGTSFESGQFAAKAGEGALGSGLSWGGLALKSGLHGHVGGVMSALQGGKFGHGFISGFAAQVAAGRIDGLKYQGHRVLAAAVLGGSVSAVTGGKFANGAITGAFSRAFNEESHQTADDPDSAGDVLTIGIQGVGGDESGGNPDFRNYVHSVGGQVMSKRAAIRAIRDAPAGTEIRLYGYSRGGNAVVGVVNWAGRNEIHIHKVVTIDPHKVINAQAGFRFKYNNVGNATNYYQNNPRTGWRGKNPFWGRPVSSKHISVEQRHFTNELVTHLNIVARAIKYEKK